MAALKDQDVNVRRTAAVILGQTTSQSRTLSAWHERKGSIIPALKVAIADDDKATRENSALALFAFGSRDVFVIKLITQAACDPARAEKSEFVSALKVWEAGR